MDEINHWHCKTFWGKWKKVCFSDHMAEQGPSNDTYKKEREKRNLLSTDFFCQVLEKI